jgi:hypothetical protein
MNVPEWVKQAAPLIGSALGGPFGAIAAGVLADRLGVPDKTVKAVSDALQADKLTPEQVAQVRAAEVEFARWADENKLKREQLVFDNTKNARDMQIATRSIVPAALALVVTLGFFGILAAMMTGHATKSDEMMIMLGSLGTAWTGIIGFYFGSSAGSQHKDDLLARSAPGNNV